VTATDNVLRSPEACTDTAGGAHARSSRRRASIIMSAHDLRDIARRLGGEASGRNHVICPGPGHTKRDRSLSVRFDSGAPEGFLVNSFAGDDPIRCRDYVRRQLGFPAWQPGDERNRNVSSQRREFDQAAMEREAEYRCRTEDDLIRIKRADELWHSAKDPRRTAAEDYLRTRALKLDDDLVDTVLRFHPHCPWRNEDTGLTEIPALLAAFRSLDDDEITGVHRIRLDQPQYWPKTRRMMLGVVRRAAVKLVPAAHALAVAEGLETAMAANKMGYGPAWALGSAGAIALLPTLPWIEHLILLAENNDASRAATERCGKRWFKAGRRVTRIWPKPGCDDLNVW
jgi:putative DNA primase/helicase